MSGWTLRMRFRVPPGVQLGVDGPEIAVDLDEIPRVRIKALGAESIKEAEWLAISTDGWKSQEEAESAANLLLDSLRMAFSRFGMSVNLGGRAPSSFFTDIALERMSETAGRPIMNDIHGVMVYPSEDEPLLARSGSSSLTRTVQWERWRTAFVFAASSGHALSERERIAFDVYDAAFWVREIPEARFAVLFAAVETLLEQVARPDDVVDHLDSLIQATKNAGLSRSDADSVIGTLRWMRTESIRKTGRRFVENRLGNRLYGDRTAVELFLDCYDVRNRLLHGTVPLPARDEVGSHAASLEKMVADLIAGPTLQLDV